LTQDTNAVASAKVAPEDTSGYKWADDAEALATAPVGSAVVSHKATSVANPRGESAGYVFATEETNESLDHTGFAARGTLLFVMIMLLGYAIYWAYLWFIVVIERGVGGF